MTNIPASISELEPGTAIELGDITELPLFEDAVVLDIEPEMDVIDTELWAGRLPVRELIRPAKFYGRIGNIVLHTFDDPYEKLSTVRERGLKLTTKGGNSADTRGKRMERFADKQIPRFRGFQLTASAYSSGRGEIGQIQSELYYFPVRIYRTARGQLQKDRNVSAGASIKRVVTKPEVTSEEDFIRLDDLSRTIAFSVLRANLKNAKPQPFHN